MAKDRLDREIESEVWYKLTRESHDIHSFRETIKPLLNQARTKVAIEEIHWLLVSITPPKREELEIYQTMRERQKKLEANLQKKRDE